MDLNPRFLSLLQDLYIVFTVAFSAATYLINYVATVASGIEFYKIGREDPSKLWVFIYFVGLFVMANTLNAVVFKLDLNEPISTAYLLPLQQLRRLLQAVYSTFSREELRRLRADQRTTLFNYVAAALETAPHLQLQLISVFHPNYGEARKTKIIYVSIVSSFISGTVNGALAITSVTQRPTATFPQHFALLIVAGSFTLSVLFISSVIFVAVFVWVKESSTLVAIIVVVNLWRFLLCMAILKDDHITEMVGTRPSRSMWVLRSITFAIMGTGMGFLYPVANHARATKEFGKTVYWKRLLIIEGADLGRYIIVLAACILQNRELYWFQNWVRCCYSEGIGRFPFWQLPCCFYMPTYAVAVALYAASMTCYILLDARMEEGASRSQKLLELDYLKSFSKSDAEGMVV